ncbi:TPA: cytochrome-c3 hydrogenase, partial [Candidatus Geothermarchaeota archaeon]|nr:cytochrome-c3 hydrogenase [Candidatus Geothermarchaeota archaeon]
RKSAVIHAGAWDNGTLKPLERDKITEDVKYAKYDDAISGKIPWEVEMRVDLIKKDKPNAYSWMKAPRYDGEVYEVGPLARMIVTFGLNWNIEVTNPVTGETVKFEWKVMNPMT